MDNVKKEVFQISFPYATFGIIVVNNVVKDAAPIGAWMIGKGIDVVAKWVYSKYLYKGINGSMIKL